LAIAEEERAVAAQATLEGMNLVEDDAKADRVIAASAWIANWREASEAKVEDGTAAAAVAETVASNVASAKQWVADWRGRTLTAKAAVPMFVSLPDVAEVGTSREDESFFTEEELNDRTPSLVHAHVQGASQGAEAEQAAAASQSIASSRQSQASASAAAPAAEDETTRRMVAAASQWIANWRQAFVRQQEAEAAAALASRQESAQEWIENWRASTAALAIAEEERAVAAQATLEGMNLVEDDAKADRVIAASAWIANWREASEAKVILEDGTAAAAVSLTSAQAAASSVAPIQDAPAPINVDALRWAGESSAADVSVDVDALRWVGEDTSAPYPAAPAAPSPPAPAVNVDALRWAGEEEGTVLPRLTRPLAPNTVDNMRRLRDVVSTQERRALRRQIEMAEAPPMPSAPPTPSLAVTIQRIVRLVAESLLFLVVAIVGRITAFVQGSGRPKAA